MNKKMKGDTIYELSNICANVSRWTSSYNSTANSRRENGKCMEKQDSLHEPHASFLNVNFDAAYNGDIATTRILCRDSYGFIKFAEPLKQGP